MRTFFCPEIKEPGYSVELEERERKHLFGSLRKCEGDKVLLIDGAGTVATALVKSAGLLIEGRRLLPQPCPELHLFVSPPHIRGRMDVILAQCTELGVRTITPILCRNSVSRPDTAPDRWRRHLVEACKQSQNPYLPILNDVEELASAASRARNSGMTCFFGDTSPASGKNHIPALKSAAWFVGPEGGFTGEESAQMLEKGFIPLKIGGWTLRTETAAAAGLAVLAAGAVCREGT